jgi:alpha-2-macroglobulin
MNGVRYAGIALIAMLLSLQTFAQQTQPLSIVIATPKGATATLDQTQSIVVSFSEPMVPLREVPTDESSGPMTITPAIKGKYRWMGTRTLTFIPADSLPASTAYTVTIPAGTKAVSGYPLLAPYVWTFETPRPRVLRTRPRDNQEFVELDHTILIQFNQKVDPDVAAKSISIKETIGSETRFPSFKAQTPDSLDKISSNSWEDRNWGQKSSPANYTVELRIDGLMKKNARYQVTCKAGLRGVEGPLGMAEERIFSFRTYGELTFLGVGNEKGFSPGQRLRLNFSNPVLSKDVARLLEFNPPLVVDTGSIEWDYPQTTVYLSVPFAPQKTYAATLRPGLRDRFGNTLTTPQNFTVVTGAFTPYVHMTTGPGVLEGYASHNYPVTFMNVDSVRLSMGVLTPDRIVPLMQRLDFSYYEELAMNEATLGSPESKSEEQTRFSLSRIWRIGGTANKSTIRPVSLDEVVGKDGRGVVLMQVDNLLPGDRRRYLKAVLQVTDFGITAKFAPGSTLVWVTRLKDTQPVADVTIELRSDSNKVFWTGKTDKNGLAEGAGWGTAGLKSADEWRSPRVWVVVQKEKDIAFTNSEWQEGIEPWQFNVPQEWNPKLTHVLGSVMTDRGLYKAGEKVLLKSIIRKREEKEWQIPRGEKYVLSIRNPRDEEIVRSTLRVSDFGSFDTAITLGSNAALGYYTVRLTMPVTKKGKEEGEDIGGTSFRVEAFRAAEFDVTAQLSEKAYIAGDSVRGAIDARYLFGAALRNEAVTWRLSLAGGAWIPDGYDGYYFGPMEWLSRYTGRSNYKPLASGETKLDDKGGLQVVNQIKVGDIAGTGTLMLEADVTAPNRQVISGRTSAQVHGGEYYIGVKPSTTFLGTDSTLTYNLLAVTPEGKKKSGAELTVKIFRRVWRSVRKAESGGRYAWTSEEENIRVDSLQVVTTDDPITKSFKTPQAGFYFMNAEGKDARGNQLLTQTYFYVTGSDYVAWERSNDDRIDLVADKLNYAPGGLASILVKSPYEEATALISVEREGILKHYTTRLVGSAPRLTIPIERDYLPNVFVSVVLLQGRKGEPATSREGDPGKPSFKVGYVKLPVSPLEKQLTLRISSDKKEYRPGDSVSVNIKITDQAGKGVASEVALSVADLGVLNLTGYRLPRLFDMFYAERPLAVKTTETRMHLVEQREYGEKGEDEGGGGADEKMMSMVDAEGIRKDFRPSAYWNPSIMTKANGEATVRFKLPDNLTAFQLMSVAHTKGSDFGYGENSLTVSKPLLLQPAFPRFARVGDKFEGGVVIVNYSSKEKKVRITTRTSGAQFEGKDSTVIELKPGQSMEIRNRYVADKVGKAVFTYKAVADGDADGMQWTIPINVPRTRETVALYESTTDSLVHEKIQVPADLFPDLGGVEVTAASTAMIGLSGGMSYLFTYPYGCLEQRVSSVLPIILARDLVEAFKFDVFKDKDYRQAVTKVLEELPAFQREDGGFAYWKNEDRTWPYISAYATYAMVQAKRAGYPIREADLKEAFSYLRRFLNGEISMPFYSLDVIRSTHALVCYTFALAGEPDFGAMERLYRVRSELPLFARAYLLRSLHAARGNKEMIADLARDLLNQAKVSPASAHFEDREDAGWAWMYSSNTRTTALVMQALVETQPENALYPKVVRWLLEKRTHGCWRTTQENLYVVDALATYFKKYEKDEPKFRVTVQVAGKQALTEMFEGRNFKTASATQSWSGMTQGTEYPVDFTKTGPGRLYYGVRMNYYPKTDRGAAEEGLAVSKTMEPVTLPTGSANRFAPGSIIRVTIAVATNKENHFVVVDDPVPAGVEIVNRSFRTTAMQLPGDQPENREWWEYEPFNHTEMKDDRVLLFADYLTAGVHTYTYLVRATSFGTYQMPSTRAEGMYEPEVFGRTSMRTIEVR